MAMNVGILGIAHGHVDTYCRRWRENTGLGIVPAAIWDHDAERARAAGERHSLAVCASSGELLARADIDAVVIGAETSLHADLVEQAASARRPIVLQKPVALTLEEADRIVAATESTGTPFTMAWQMRVDPQNLHIRELLQSGVLGRICIVRRRHTLATHTWAEFDKTWHVNPALNRDIWADDASHPIDFVYWLLGMPASVTAELGTLINPRIPNDNGIAVFRYADGTFAEVICSFTCIAGENTTEIIGEKGVLIQSYGDAPSAAAPRPADAPGLKWILQGDKAWSVSAVPSPKSQGERIAGLAAPLAEFLHGRRGPIATAHEGREVLRMTLACYDSAQEGRRIRLGA